jgi:hypothetical protein
MRISTLFCANNPSIGTLCPALGYQISHVVGQVANPSISSFFVTVWQPAPRYRFIAVNQPEVELPKLKVQLTA